MIYVYKLRNMDLLYIFWILLITFVFIVPIVWGLARIGFGYTFFAGFAILLYYFLPIIIIFGIVYCLLNLFESEKSKTKKFRRSNISRL